jgi:hypothetical protein
MADCTNSISRDNIFRVDSLIRWKCITIRFTHCGESANRDGIESTVVGASQMRQLTAKGDSMKLSGDVTSLSEEPQTKRRRPILLRYTAQIMIIKR